MDRRTVLKAFGLGVAATSVGGLWTPAVAGPVPQQRLVVLVLRGGMDGLAAVAPYGDPKYRALRDDVALPLPGESGGLLDLDGHFGLHPALAPIHGLFAAGELAVVHGAALPYRRRSHFDAQKLLENGTADQPSNGVGWLNRALSVWSGPQPIAFSADVPLILQGPQGHASVDPQRKDKKRDRLYGLLAEAYAEDPLLRDALQMGRDTLTQVVAQRGELDRKASTGRVVGGLMASPKGPRVAVLQMGGWDTHTGQLGRHDRQFRELAKTLSELRAGLGAAWKHTVVVAASEFGRTVRANGTGGTDHGTAGAALVLGGAVRGGRIAGDFAGLGTLHEDRDLLPTTDLRSVFKGILAGHLGLERSVIDSRVFPNSQGAPAMVSLVKPKV